MGPSQELALEQSVYTDHFSYSLSFAVVWWSQDKGGQASSAGMAECLGLGRRYTTTSTLSCKHRLGPGTRHFRCHRAGGVRVVRAGGDFCVCEGACLEFYLVTRGRGR